jgi:D-alanyl-lipoteichoic acid acyltransferase DltB (MBOAT superfamily)
MLFNSIDFAVFLPVVFLLYWFATGHNLKIQNALIVAASYFFYGWWDWRFLSLILFSTLVDYTTGLLLHKENHALKRKLLLFLSIAVNLGFLGFFKYYQFFIDNFMAVFRLFGHRFEAQSLSVVLPVGISFYTFQTMSYTLDVYFKKLEPTRDFIAFTAFVSFFPQLVAGPIERATNLLPQFFRQRSFDYVKATDGMRQILWGLFKKMVIADNCAGFANDIFNNSWQANGSTLLLGAVFFAFQIYGDFSGYSDIAIGTSRLFGFELMRNFNYPYFSRDIAEFWRRWHISLSTWFRDYLYIPLGGSRGNRFSQIRNTLIIFIVSGFWHGANWTFIVWGALNALYFLPSLISGKNRTHLDTVAEGRIFPNAKEWLSMLSTFALTVLAWIFFRASDLTHAFDYLHGIFSPTLFAAPHITEKSRAIATAVFILFLLVMEWRARTSQYALANFTNTYTRLQRHVFYYALILLIFWYGGQEQEFIYFQF